VLLHRKHKRLDDEYVSLTAVGSELHAKTIVAESRGDRPAAANLQSPADTCRKLNMGVPTEDDYSVHRNDLD
jgi:hypothetical protein